MTADSAQGREFDVVVISMVRSNAEGCMGFVSDRHRTCVMLSRARQLLCIVGSKGTVRSAPAADGSDWQAVLLYCEAGKLAPRPKGKHYCARGWHVYLCLFLPLRPVCAVMKLQYVASIITVRKDFTNLKVKRAKFLT